LGILEEIDCFVVRLGGLLAMTCRIFP